MGKVMSRAMLDGRLLVNDYIYNVTRFGIYQQQMNFVAQARERVRRQFAIDVSEFWDKVGLLKWDTTEDAV